MVGSSTGTGTALPNEGDHSAVLGRAPCTGAAYISEQGCCVLTAAQAGMLSAYNLSSEPMVSLGGRRGHY